jgi:O-methyltransferase
MVLLKRLIRRVLYNSRYVIVKDMPKIGRERRITVSADEYVRTSSLELVADEIYSQSIQGSVAEVGVFRGEFASLMNRVFPDRKLYLFDTFEGFDARDKGVDIKNGYSDADEPFTTTVELVLEKMSHPANCVIKKGWFPESAEGISEPFACVSLDADLYQPIYNGLRFFFPLLTPRGYIFVHDYNNAGYAGAKQAVRQFCSEQNLAYFPLTDRSGTAVIAK